MSSEDDRQCVLLTFLGVGGASQEGLGHASAVVEIDHRRLLIDCGPGTVRLFRARFNTLPDAIFLTHCHLDHIGDFENLFIKSWFSDSKRRIKIFVPASLIVLLNQRVATYPSVLAEGGVNFWDAFQLIPVADDFIFNDFRFQVLPVRHHAPGSAFGLRLPEAFFYTGDTRPVPEVLQHSLSDTETIFHDCSVVGNPSHTGIDDLQREYPQAIIQRIYCYHYYTEHEVQAFEKAGLHVVKQNQQFTFSIERPCANHI